jgi:hypothetical protein
MTVHTMPGVSDHDKPASGQPQQDLIEAIEKLLAAAKTGEVQAVAFAVIGDDRDIKTGWKGGFVACELMAAVAWLYFRYGRAFDDGEAMQWVPREGS